MRGSSRVVSLRELFCLLRSIRPGILGMNYWSAIRLYRTCLENLGNNILSEVVSVERRPFREHVDNMETLDVPHNC
jgi:hypothetical protein